MKTKSKELFYLDKQGNIHFRGQKDTIKTVDARDSFYEHPIAALFMMLVCGFVDVINFKSLFETITYESPLSITVGVIALFIAYDVSAIYLGIELKKKKQGLNYSPLTIKGCIFAFMIGFIGNLCLRVMVKDQVMPDYSIGTSVLEKVSSATNINDLALVYALFTASMPLITSLVCVAVSYITYNPVKGRVKRLKKEQIELENRMAGLEAVLMEYESDIDRYDRLMLEDREQYQDTLDQIHEMTMTYCHYVRQRLKEHLGNPVSSNILSMDIRGELTSRIKNNRTA